MDDLRILHLPVRLELSYDRSNVTQQGFTIKQRIRFFGVCSALSFNTAALSRVICVLNALSSFAVLIRHYAFSDCRIRAVFPRGPFHRVERLSVSEGAQMLSASGELRLLWLLELDVSSAPDRDFCFCWGCCQVHTAQQFARGAECLAGNWRDRLPCRDGVFQVQHFSFG